MARYKFLKPDINVGDETLKRIRSSPQFWIILSISTIGMIWGILLIIQGKDDRGAILTIAILLVSYYIFLVYNRVEKEFWEKFANINGWQYQSQGDVSREDGLMFKEGRENRIFNVISGSIDEKAFKIFHYKFVKGFGRHKITYFYTVFAFKFSGNFPHIYLDSHHNFYSISAGEEVPLPDEFSKKFKLSSPKKYEIEALQIFTPDVLDYLLQLQLKHDIEFINQEMIIFAIGKINKIDQLEKEFDIVLEIKDLLEQKLDSINFTPVGNMPHTL